ncbi:MAG: dTDP-glucose 4,6-dehydratase [Myxococcota bacterium]|nr:dTDP-glucose 4,6-dehydratase [Myxococcota bacterium]
MHQETLLVTGGAGFIGSNFVTSTVLSRGCRVVNLDKLTYAGNPESLATITDDPSYVFAQGDICDRALVARLLDQFEVTALVNFAAESHVDRSISGPREFVQTNVVGTFELLEACRAYVAALPRERAAAFRFLHVSTDEVFGALGPSGHFTEDSVYRPNSPYAASKAAADHFVRAYFKTYGLPTLTTNCSNNYGPRQFPEKLIPLVILNALEGRPLPVYGNGLNVRDWLYVDDHCDALRIVLERGSPGQTYAIGGRNEMTNISLVETICDLLQELAPSRPSGNATPRYRDLIRHVPDRPGHDQRYAIDPSKTERDLGWSARHTMAAGLRKTLLWYLDNRAWCDRITAGVYRRERLGLLAQPTT